MERLAGRVAVVTGGSRGIGREIVSRLAADGMAVVVGYSANKDQAEEAVTAVTDGGGRAGAGQADGADENAVAAMLDTAERRVGGGDPGAARGPSGVAGPTGHPSHGGGAPTRALAPAAPRRGAARRRANACSPTRARPRRRAPSRWCSSACPPSSPRRCCAQPS